MLTEPRTMLGLLDVLIRGKGRKNSTQRAEYGRAVLALETRVIPLCETETKNAAGTTLYDWLYKREFHTTDTPDSLAAEWDERSE